MTPSLPTDYLDYMKGRKPWEGFTREGDTPGCVVLWSLDQLDEFNLDYAVEELAPGYIGFGGNGGGELLAFDISGAVFMLPMIGLAADVAIKVAGSFTELLARVETAA